jgi:hypothetical protein
MVEHFSGCADVVLGATVGRKSWDGLGLEIQASCGYTCHGSTKKRQTGKRAHFVGYIQEPEIRRKYVVSSIYMKGEWIKIMPPVTVTTI